MRLVITALLAGLTACNPRADRPGEPARGAVSAAPTAPAANGIYYTFRLSSGLDELSARVCFRGAVPEKLAPPMGAAAPFLREVTHRETALPRQEGAVLLDGVGDGDCVDYAVGVAKLFETRQDGARKLGQDVLLSPDWWLWPPEPRGKEPLYARFAGERGAIVPWPEIDHDGYTHRIPDSCFLWKAQAAFGAFERRTIEPRRGRLDVFLLGGGFGSETGRVMGWLERSAASAAGLFGRFPLPRAQVLLVAEERRGTFGYVLRGGGPAATLLLPRAPDDEALDWVAVHELLHLVLPPMPPEDAWLFEGLITYLAAVARAQSGMISEERAWWELFDGFARGAAAGTGKTTREESRLMHETRAYWRVYWAGAAMALAWEVALRRRGSSLAAVLSELIAAELEPSRRHRASELIAKLDALCGCDVFSRVTAAHLDEVAFPDTTAIAASLGVRAGEPKSARFDEAAPEAAIRRAIMRASAL